MFAPRLLPWHLLVVAIASLFVVLGLWQLERHRQQQAANALLERRIAADPLPYRELAPRLDPDAPEGAADDPRFRPVFVDGILLPQHEVLVRGRSLDGQPGYHLLTPLRLAGTGASDDPASGRAVLVDRGWIPFQDARPNDPAYAPAAGPVLVLGRLMPEADAPSGPLAAFAPRDPEEGALDSVARADVDRLQEQIPLPLDRFVIEATGVQAMAGATSASGAATAGSSGFPRIPPPAGPHAGPHLGYAVQWFFFALVAIVGYVALLRRRAADRGAPQPSGEPPDR